MSNVTNLKLIYAQLINGYSFFDFDGKTYYIKHLNYLSSSDIDIQRDRISKTASLRGLKTNADQLKFLIDNKDWSEQNEANIKEYQGFIENLKLTKTKLPLKRDRDLITKEISDWEFKLYRLLREKNQLMGLTVEKYSEKKINEYYIYVTLYVDKSLTTRYFKEEEFNELEQNKLDLIVKMYNENVGVFNSDNLKRISLMPFFMNLLMISDDNPFYFYGKPIIELTFYQLDLFQFGKQFKHILNNSKITPPVEILNDPDKLIEWFSATEAAEKLIGTETEQTISTNSDNIAGGSSIVGARKEDYETLGIENTMNKKLEEQIKTKGELSMMDILKLHDIKTD